MSSIDEDLDRLREYVDGLVKDGGLRLPPEPKLSQTLGVSRGRLRTVLKRLEDEGLIWRHVGKGTFVGAREADKVADWSKLISLDNVLDARSVLEPQLAAQAAFHATPADMAAIDACMADMNRATSFLQWRSLDEKLHRTIAEAAHNPLLLLLYDALREQVRLHLESRIEQVFGDDTQPKKETDDEHQRCVDAIRAHDPPKAQEAMREHLSSVRNHLFGLR